MKGTQNSSLFGPIRPAESASACWRAPSGRWRQAGVSILEVTLALAIFTVASASLTVGYGLLNASATRLRCDAAAQAILRAKVAKVLTDPWINTSTPVDCVVTSGEVTSTSDPADPYDVGPTVTLLTQSAAPGTALVSGTLYRNTRAFEAAANTVLIDYRLAYTFRGRVFSARTSTIRARDK